MTYCSCELPKLQKSSSDGTTPLLSEASSSFSSSSDTSGSHNRLLMLTRLEMGDGSGSDPLTSSSVVEATVRARFCSFEIDLFSASVRQGRGLGAGRLHPQSLRVPGRKLDRYWQASRSSTVRTSFLLERLRRSWRCLLRRRTPAEGQAPGPFVRTGEYMSPVGGIAADCCGGPYWKIGSGAVFAAI
jgi:hypothetical protein